MVPQLGAVAAGPTGSLEPLSQASYRLQLNTSESLKQKLELAAKLMTHSNPSGDLAVVVERALDLLVDQLQKERFGKTARPRRYPTKPEDGVGKPPCTSARSVQRAQRRRAHIPNEVLRQLVERDGLGCSYTSEGGHRCGEQAFLQVHHEKAWARGGSDELHNLRLLCASHNRFVAEQELGRQYVASAIEEGRASRHTGKPSSSRAEGSGYGS